MTKRQKAARKAARTRAANRASIHKIDEFLDRWDKRITLKNFRVAERFARSEINILLHIRHPNSGKVWVACLEKIPLVGGGNPVGLNKPIGSSFEQVPVFVDIVEFVDSPERLCSAMVRLEPVNSFYSTRLHSLYLSGLVGFVSGFILRNRELYLSRGFLAGSAYQNKLVGEMIESTPEIVDGIARCGQDVKGDDGDLLASIRRSYLQCLQISLTNLNCLVSVPKLGKFDFEVAEVLLGPLDFGMHENQMLKCG